LAAGTTAGPRLERARDGPASAARSQV